MSFAPDTPQSSLGDNTPGRANTYKQAEPVPLFFGRARIGVKWITPVLNWHYITTKTSSVAFFNCVGVIAHGPLDYIHQIIVNEKSYNGVFKHREDFPNFCEHTISKQTTERFRFYWGQEDQSGVSAYIDAISNGLIPAHSQCRGIALLAVSMMEAGYVANGRTPALPNIEVDCYRRSPTAYSFGHDSHGTNAAGAIKDTLMDKRGGLGLPAKYFDSAHWDAAMTRLHTQGVGGVTGKDLWISPIAAQMTEASAFVSDMLGYFDGFLRWKNGKIQVDWFANDGTPPGPVRELSMHDMTAEPDLDAEGLDKIKTLVAVTALDETTDPSLTEIVEVQQVPYARQLVGEDRVEKVSRPFFTRRDQARNCAAQIAAQRASPDLEGKLKVRRESATLPDGITPLLPGDRFQLDYAPFELDVLCRVLERTESDDKAEVTLRFRKEPGATPQPYLPPLDPRASLTLPLPSAMVRFAVTEVPGSSPRRVALLAEQPAGVVYGCKLHYTLANTWPGTVLAEFSTWSVGAILKTALAAATAATTIRIEAPGRGWERLASQSSVEQQDDRLLLINNGEWMSVGAITPVSAGVYDLAVLRARQGSAAAVHALNDAVFLVLRDELATAEHAEFNTDGVQHWFKVQAYNTSGDGPLSNSFGVYLGDRTPPAPTGFGATSQAEAIALAWDFRAPESGEYIGIYERTAATPAPVVTDAPTYSTSASSYYRGGLIGGATRYFWIVRFDNEGRASSLIGPVTGVAGSAGGPAGPAGPTGPAGNMVERRYRRSMTTPTILNTDPTPSGWTTTIPDGTEALWASEATKTEAGALVTNWSAPARLSGNATFFLSGIATPGAYLNGDMAIDISDGNKPYRREGGTWVSVLPSQIPTLESGLTAANNRINQKVTRGTTAPATPNVGDFWIDTSGGGLVPKTWNGSAWQDAKDSRLATLESTINTPTTGIAARVTTVENTITTPGTGLAARVTAVESAASTAQSTASAAATAASTAQSTAEGAQATANSAVTAVYETPLRSGNLLENSEPKGTLGWSVHGTTSVTFVDGWDPWRPFGTTGSLVVIQPTMAGESEFIVRSDAPIPVEAGARYELSGYLSAHRCAAYIYVAWEDGDGGYITEASGGVHAPFDSQYYGTLSTFPRASAFVTAPAGAARARVVIRAHTWGQSSQTDVHVFFSQVYFGRATPTQTEFSEWSPGPDRLRTEAAQSTATAAVTAASTAQAGVNTLAAEYVLQVVTDGGGNRRIAGFRITNQGGAGGSTEMVFQADKFHFVNATGGGMVSPFFIEGGVVYINTAVFKNAAITSAMIASLDANKINASSLSAITATIGTLQTATSGQRVVIKDNLIEWFDASNVRRGRIGIWS